MAKKTEQPTRKQIKRFKLVVGENLRLARLRRRLTQTQLANAVGCTQYHISRLEWGDQNVTLTMLLKLSFALEMMPQELVDDKIRGRFAI